MKIQLTVSLSKEEANVLQNALDLNDNTEYAKVFELQDTYKQQITFDAPFSWTVKYASILGKLAAFIKNAIPLFKEYTSVLEESKKFVTVSE